jgi:hypothetical protein
VAHGAIFNSQDVSNRLQTKDYPCMLIQKQRMKFKVEKSVGTNPKKRRHKGFSSCRYAKIRIPDTTHATKNQAILEPVSDISHSLLSHLIND